MTHQSGSQAPRRHAPSGSNGPSGPSFGPSVGASPSASSSMKKGGSATRNDGGPVQKRSARRAVSPKDGSSPSASAVRAQPVPNSNVVVVQSD
jgi:hypothetical protein